MVPPASQPTGKKWKYQRSVTFSKQKAALFDKLTELYIRCNVEAAAIVTSPKGKLFACGYPSIESVLGWFDTQALQPDDGDMRRQLHEEIETERAEYEALQKELKEEEKRPTWWEISIDNMELEELVEFTKSVEEFSLMVREQVINNENNKAPPPSSATPLVTNIQASDNCGNSQQQVASGSRINSSFEIGSSSGVTVPSGLGKFFYP